MIIEDGVFWDVTGCDCADVDDPFSGMEEEYVNALETAYSQYCLSVKSHQSICVMQNKDIDSVSIDDGLYESKSLGHWGSRPSRIKYGNRIRVSTRYRNLISTEHSQASKSFRKDVAAFQGQLKKLVHQFVSGSLDSKILRRKSTEAFTVVYTKAWEAGRRASGLYRLQKRPQVPSREEETKFRAAVREELTFWQSFLDDLIDDKKLVNKRFTVEERVEMYAKTVWFMFQLGRLSGMPDTVLLHWFPKRKRSGTMCPGCQYMVDNSPYPRDLMPTTPRAGDTPCLMRCVHKIIVRYVTPGAVKRRRKELPTKERMLNDLVKFMGKKVRKQKGRGKDYNPWIGSKTWGMIR